MGSRLAGLELFGSSKTEGGGHKQPGAKHLACAMLFAFIWGVWGWRLGLLAAKELSHSCSFGHRRSPCAAQSRDPAQTHRNFPGHALLAASQQPVRAVTGLRQVQGRPRAHNGFVVGYRLPCLRAMVCPLSMESSLVLLQRVNQESASLRTKAWCLYSSLV